MLIKSRLMAPEGDPSPSGGGAPGTPAPTATPAPGPAPAIDTAALARDVAATVRDSIFAELRKSGVLGKPAAPPATDSVAPSGTPAPAPSVVDVEALLERRENFAHALGKFDVPESAIPRARKAFTSEKPDDVNGWVATFASEMGWKQRNAPAPASAGSPAATTATATTITPHVTERPGPPAAHVVTDDTPLRSMSESDREAYRRKVGDIKFADRYLEELKGVRVKTRPF